MKTGKPVRMRVETFLGLQHLTPSQKKKKMFSDVYKIHRITKEIVLQNKVSKTLKENCH